MLNISPDSGLFQNLEAVPLNVGIFNLVNSKLRQQFNATLSRTFYELRCISSNLAEKLACMGIFGQFSKGLKKKRSNNRSAVGLQILSLVKVRN